MASTEGATVGEWCAREVAKKEGAEQEYPGGVDEPSEPRWLKYANKPPYTLRLRQGIVFDSILFPIRK